MASRSQKIIGNIVPSFGEWKSPYKWLYIKLSNLGLIPFPINAYIAECVKDGRAIMSPCEMQILADGLFATSFVEGDVAEVGVFRGGSAKIMLDYRYGRRVWLCDTFTGLPLPQPGFDSPSFHVGDFKANFEDVENYLEQTAQPFDIRKDCVFVIGEFPKSMTSTVSEMAMSKFSFVHLDMDLHDGTRDALNFFCTRLSVGGIIVCHDFTCSRGVRDAVTSFWLANDKRFIMLPVVGGTQAMLIKVAE